MGIELSCHAGSTLKNSINWKHIPDVYNARELLKAYFPTQLFPRLNCDIQYRLASQFPNWNQCIPDIRVARQDWDSLRDKLDNAGQALPLAVISQISYGTGMGHPRIGLHRGPKFNSEIAHTYMYHAAPGLSLKNGQAADYNRIDYISRKPTLYIFWLLNYEICYQASDELHDRWNFYRYHRSDEKRCDCATFVNDFSRHIASIGNDSNNPFNYTIPSHTILAPVNPENRGVYAILRYAHRPPAMLLFVQDPITYDRLCCHGYEDHEGWVVNQDANEFNITRQ